MQGAPAPNRANGSGAAQTAGEATASHRLGRSVQILESRNHTQTLKMKNSEISEIKTCEI